ncbi:MAG: hypothetical protein JXX29_19860 [Deltaproteobacteria bacterium]|nr:hypothetical protein [Deltaproteobacteria bacterium]MBN2673947.1 hypothetical protein [Deltaproteobacteria bacterium]
MKEKNKLIPSSPGTKEGAAQFLRNLRDVDMPQALVQQLGAHDLLLAIEEADDEQRADLLTLCSREQFHQMLDFSCWDGFEPNLEQVEEVIAPLVHTGIGGALRAIDKLGDELKTLMFKERIVVHLREEKDEDFPDVPDTSDFITTPDGYYGIEIPNADTCPDVIKELLRAITFKTFEEYQPELEAIRHELKFELMEDALRWRNGRLADLGFGTYEEGLALLAPRSVDSAQRVVAQKSIPRPVPLDANIPAIYREHLKGRTLLDASFELLANAKDPKWQQRAAFFQGELSATVSLFLTAIQCRLSDVNAVAKGTELARDVIELGLGSIASSPQEGAEALAYLTPGEILQVGMGRLIPLRERALKLRRDKRFEGIALAPPWQVVLDCLGAQIPMWWPVLNENYSSASELEPLLEDLESISSESQVQLANAYLDEVEAVAAVVQQLNWNGTADAAPVMPSTLLLTLLANAFVDGTPSLDRVSRADAKSFASAFLNQPTHEMLVSGMKVLTLSLNVAADGVTEPEREPDAMRRMLLRLLLIGRERLEAEAYTSPILTN